MAKMLPANSAPPKAKISQPINVLASPKNMSLLCQHPMHIGNFSRVTTLFRSFADLENASY
jgi:hypothetical protein